MPRPAGRSGWVSTSGTAWPAAWMAASAVDGELGRSRKSDAHAHQRLRTRLLVARLLEHLGLDAVALERAQVVDEDLAHQVIHLVLDADGRQALGVELVGLAVAAERAHAHAGVALDLLVDLRHRQAALLAQDPVVGAGDQLGVDQHARLVVRLGGVHHDQADVAGRPASPRGRRRRTRTSARSSRRPAARTASSTSVTGLATVYRRGSG